MIIVTRLNGSEVVLNADLIETVESTPDTIVTLIGGTRYVVEESPSTIVDRIRAYSAAVLLLGDSPVVDPASIDHTPQRADVVAFPLDRSED